MLAERLFFRNRPRQGFIDHLLETFVTIRSHGFLLRTATAAWPDLDKSWKRPSRPALPRWRIFPVAIDPPESEGRVLRDSLVPVLATSGRAPRHLLSGLRGQMAKEHRTQVAAVHPHPHHSSPG